MGLVSRTAFLSRAFAPLDWFSWSTLAVVIRRAKVRISGIARSALSFLREKLQVRGRAAIVLPRFSPEVGSRKVFFLTPDYDVPAGGVQVLYRHVDILNAAGLPAFIVHQRSSFRCTWFENQTAVCAASSVVMGPADLLVVPELDVDLLERLAPGTRHVIFNQNSHLTWQRLKLPGTQGQNGQPVAILTVSAHNAAMVRYALPDRTIGRLHLGINEQLFNARSDRRVRRITYMPRRGGGDAQQVLSMLRSRGSLDGWEVVPLHGLSHEQVATELRRSQIFLAFTYQEGFGLPAAEAMAAGNYVIGYHGYGGQEFFQPEFSSPVVLGDVLAFAKAIEAALACEAALPGWCMEQGQRASRYILANYSRERETQDVVRLYRRYLELPEAEQ